jgi:hypothetical protein
MEQKLYQSEAYPLSVELQEFMEIISGGLSHRPVKFAVFCRWLLILPVYSGSISIKNRKEEIGNRIKEQGVRKKDKKLGLKGQKTRSKIKD